MFTRRCAVAVVGALALTGLSVFGAGTVHADETPGAEETSLERVNALVQPSIVYLQQDWAAYIYDKANKTYLNGGQQFTLSFQCTGFVVNPAGYIATAGHCVSLDEVKPAFFEAAATWAVDNGYYLAESLTVDDIIAFQDYRVETMDKVNRADLVIQVGWGAAGAGIETTEVRRARVVESESTAAGDVALLKVEASDLNALPLSDQEVEVGTEVVAVGYPASVDTVTDPDMAPSFKDGSISSVKTVQGGLLTVYEVSAAVSGGMSGGPTVGLDGEVIGVNSFGITGETQAFNFVRPSSQLAEVLADAGVANELSETTQAYRDGLEAYWDGDKAVAVDKLETVVHEQPTNELAADYLDKAESLPDPPAEDSGSGLPWLLIVGAAVLVAVVGGTLVLVLLLRRRGGRKATASAPAAAYPTGPAAAPVAPTGPPAPQPPAYPERTSVPIGFAGGTATATPPAPAPEAAPSAVAGPSLEHEPHFCGSCGEHVEHGRRFCTNCGTPLA